MTIRFIWQQAQRWWALTIAIVALDWITKQAVVANLSYGQEIHLLPVLDLTLRYNAGAAFSFLAEAGGWQRWLFSLIALVVVVGISWRLVKIGRTNGWEAGALSLIMAGALGNLHDRLAYGHVIDFIQVHWQQSWYFPAFNVADSAITVGVILMLLEGLLVKPNKGEK